MNVDVRNINDDDDGNEKKNNDTDVTKNMTLVDTL